MTAAITLKKLARSYAQGELDKESYRSARTKLLDAVVLGEMVVEDLDFPPPVVPPETTEEDITSGQAKGTQDQAEATTQMGYTPPAKEEPNSAETITEVVSPEPSAAQVETTKSSNNLLLYGLIGGIVLLVIAIVLSLTTGEKEQTGTSTEQTTVVDSSSDEATTTTDTTMEDTDEVIEDEPVSASNITAAASQVIDNFLTDKNWSKQRLDEFVIQWRSLSEDDRTSVTGSGEYSQLINAIYKQLLEEKALSAIGDAEAAKAKQQVLVDFANQIGITDSRIKVN